MSTAIKVLDAKGHLSVLRQKTGSEEVLWYISKFHSVQHLMGQEEASIFRSCSKNHSIYQSSAQIFLYHELSQLHCNEWNCAKFDQLKDLSWVLMQGKWGAKTGKFQSKNCAKSLLYAFSERTFGVVAQMDSFLEILSSFFGCRICSQTINWKVSYPIYLAPASGLEGNNCCTTLDTRIS